MELYQIWGMNEFLMDTGNMLPCATLYYGDNASGGSMEPEAWDKHQEENAASQEVLVVQ